jgi:2,3-bisphosphoglycerate-independent phosphoglycerate mutase
MDFKDVVIHVITDGRDSPVTDSLKNITKLQEKIDEIGFGKIATITGRFYTMDRDKRWERTKEGYEAVVNAKSKHKAFKDAIEQVKKCHSNKEFDEFIEPRIHKDYEGIKENDSFIFYNFRTDRTRQFTKAIVEKDFEGWDRNPLNVFYVGMTQFYKPMNAKVAFKDQNFENLLGKVIADNGLRQFRISETEKYAHVTFFFNGQVENPNKNEDRHLIPSPKVRTYDLQPEMSVQEIADELVERIAEEKYDLIVTNFVNGDMVGHTGITEAIDKAVVAVDKAVGKVVGAGLKHGYTMLVFADHGNAEDQRLEWRTSHTKNPVPIILISPDETLKKARLKEGKGLQDIAPTTLKILGIEKPDEMTGESLF